MYPSNESDHLGQNPNHIPSHTHPTAHIVKTTADTAGSTFPTVNIFPGFDVVKLGSFHAPSNLYVPSYISCSASLAYASMMDFRKLSGWMKLRYWYELDTVIGAGELVEAKICR